MVRSRKQRSLRKPRRSRPSGNYLSRKSPRRSKRKPCRSNQKRNRSTGRCHMKSRRSTRTNRKSPRLKRSMSSVRKSRLRRRSPIRKSRTNPIRRRSVMGIKQTCWAGYKAVGTKNSPSGKKTKSGKPKRVNNCVKIS
jgi:hypothetical protein